MSDGKIPDIDPDVPSVARVYDYLLGGKDNFASDRALAAQVMDLFPETGNSALVNKSFGSRATRYIAEQGVRQFIDLGSGIPTSPPSTHEVARDVATDAKVVYVDADPVVVAHARALREVGPGLTTIMADLRDPAAILGHPDLRDLIDFDEPYAVLLYSVVQTVLDDDEVRAIIGEYTKRMRPGGYLGLSHVSAHGDPDAIAAIHESTAQVGYPPMKFRTNDELLTFFDGFDLAEPGLVDARRWRPTSEEDLEITIPVMGAVGRKR